MKPIATLLLTVLLFIPAQSQAQSREELEFVELVERFLNIARQITEIADNNEAVIYLAIEDLSEIYEARGEPDEAVEHLKRVLQQNPDNRVIRNLVRFKLKDLYKEQRNTAKAIAELDQIISENSRADD